MAIYIPMSRMVRVPVAEFQQVASHGHLETSINGCLNVDAKPITCRDTENAQFWQAKEVEDEGLSSEDFICLTEDNKLIERTKTFKESACEWIKAHPIATAIGIAGSLGAVIALGSYISSSSSRSVAIQGADIQGADTNSTTIQGADTNSTTQYNPTTTQQLTTATQTPIATPTPTTAKTIKQTTKPTTQSATIQTAKPTTRSITTTRTTKSTAKPTKGSATPTNSAKSTTKHDTTSEVGKLKLDLEIFNSQGKQVLNIETTQMFTNGTWLQKQYSVPKHDKLQLVFDINKKHHRNVQISYTNHFELDLRKALDVHKKVPKKYIFGEFYVKTDSKGEYTADKNHNGILAASHTFFTDRGFYFLNREIEGTDGKATPSVTTKDVNLFIQSGSGESESRFTELRGGQRFEIIYNPKPWTLTEHKINIGTSRLEMLLVNHQHELPYTKLAYSAKNLPTDSYGNMCVHTEVDSSALELTNPVKTGKCE